MYIYCRILVLLVCPDLKKIKANSMYHVSLNIEFEKSQKYVKIYQSVFLLFF